MNAAARILSEGLVIANAPARVRHITLSKSALLMLSLVISIVKSALMMITVADNNRIAVGDLTSLQQKQENLLTTYSQLLLEENTWASAARIETIAQKQFGMQQPDPKKVIIIQS
jgi:cell division protein FtsL